MGGAGGVARLLRPVMAGEAGGEEGAGGQAGGAVATLRSTVTVLAPSRLQA